MIKVENLSYSYKDFFKKTCVFKSLNLSFEDKKIYLLTAPNGYGKTTLLKLIAGFLIPDEGDVFIDNIKVVSFNPELSYLVYNHSRRFYWQLEVLDNLKFFSEIYNISWNKEKFDEIIEVLRIDNKIFNKKYGELSNGNMMKINLLLCFLSEAKNYLLDEPFSAIDDKTINGLISFIKKIKDKKTIIVASARKESGIWDEVIELERL